MIAYKCRLMQKIQNLYKNVSIKLSETLKAEKCINKMSLQKNKEEKRYIFKSDVGQSNIYLLRHL